MKYSLASKCIYNRNGMCYFLASEPQPCSLCFNFVSADPALKKELKVNKPVITFYDLMMEDSLYRAMFPKSGTSVQMSLGSSYSRPNELPEDED